MPSRKRKNNCCIESTDSDSDSSFERVVLRKKKVRIITSDSDSSDSDMRRVPVRRNFRRIIYDKFSSSDSSSSSDSEIYNINNNNANALVRRNIRRIIYDKFSSSDSSSSSDSESYNINNNNASTSEVDDKGASSDSSSSHSEKCPICLLPLKSQEIGSPEMCDHVFCAVCIEEWSKNVNTCPVDRLSFGIIRVRDKLGGEVKRQIVVDTPTRNNMEIDLDLIFDHFLACEFCGSTENEHSILLCDSCSLGFHMECLDPPITYLPDGDWYCPTCQDHGV